MKRAIALAGGGPAVGLSLGALKRLIDEEKMHFDVWSTACIGAWVAVLYNQAPAGKEYEDTLGFFRQVFRPDAEYDRFPMATIFAPDPQATTKAMLEFVLSPKSYQNLVVPDMMIRASNQLWEIARNPSSWNPATLNPAIFNDILAANPFTRFMTSMIWKSPMTGLSRVYYPESPLLGQIDFKALYQPGKPVIYHNAYNLSDHCLEEFSNKEADGKSAISAGSLCACSALPYILSPVELNGKEYVEGATVDTVNFKGMLDDHPDLDEVWVSRLLVHQQVRKPTSLVDALNNLVMMFAATTTEDDVKLFKFHLKESGRPIKVIELEVGYDVDFDWTYSNLDRGIADGWRAADAALQSYKAGENALDAIRLKPKTARRPAVVATS